MRTSADPERHPPPNILSNLVHRDVNMEVNAITIQSPVDPSSPYKGSPPRVSFTLPRFAPPISSHPDYGVLP